MQINARIGPEHLHALHQPGRRLVRPLLRRGQASGAFDSDLPIGWMLTVLLEFIHAASRDASAGTLPADKAERALITTVTGAFSPPDRHRA